MRSRHWEVHPKEFCIPIITSHRWCSQVRNSIWAVKQRDLHYLNWVKSSKMKTNRPQSSQVLNLMKNWKSSWWKSQRNWLSKMYSKLWLSTKRDLTTSPRLKSNNLKANHSKCRFNTKQSPLFLRRNLEVNICRAKTISTRS